MNNVWREESFGEFPEPSEFLKRNVEGEFFANRPQFLEEKLN